MQRLWDALSLLVHVIIIYLFVHIVNIKKYFFQEVVLPTFFLSKNSEQMKIFLILPSTLLLQWKKMKTLMLVGVKKKKKKDWHFNLEIKYFCIYSSKAMFHKVVMLWFLTHHWPRDMLNLTAFTCFELLLILYCCFSIKSSCDEVPKKYWNSNNHAKTLPICLKMTKKWIKLLHQRSWDG